MGKEKSPKKSGPGKEAKLSLMEKRKLKEQKRKDKEGR